jgi:hypothetical protein
MTGFQTQFFSMLLGNTFSHEEHIMYVLDECTMYYVSYIAIYLFT